MFIYSDLAVLVLVLTFNSQVHAGKIIGGRVAAPHSRPYMALLEMTNDDQKSYCGGFLLNEDFVMTAAHCHADSYEVLLGINKYHDEIKQRLTVKQVFPHSDYNRDEYQNDIMLLKLSSKANFTKYVKPIELADQSYNSLPKSCSVSGWGQTSRKNTQMSFTLMEVNVTLIDDERCGENEYCSKGDTGTGMGDSGGPLVCEDGKAFGVVSASGRLPNGVWLYKYTKIPDNAEILNWIDFVMKYM